MLQVGGVAVVVLDAPAVQPQLVRLNADAVRVSVHRLDRVGERKGCAVGAGKPGPSLAVADGDAESGFVVDVDGFAEGQGYGNGLSRAVGVATGGGAGDVGAGGDLGALAVLGLYGVSRGQRGKGHRPKGQQDQ